jgi:hypothetical protein
LFLVTVLSVMSAIAPAFSMTCTDAVSRRIAIGNDKPYTQKRARAPELFCMKGGRFMGPVSGTHWDNLTQR